MAFVPLVAMLPVHPSEAEPPVAEQDAPIVATQVNVTGVPAVTVAAPAMIETLSVTTPESATITGAPPPLTLSVAAFEPAEVGLNTTLIVQLEPTAIEVPQVLVCANCNASVPESVMPEMGSAPVPVFVSVIDRGALATFVVSLPKARDVGDTV